MKRTKSVARKYLEAREQNRAEKKREQQEQQQEIALANARALEAQKKQYLYEAGKQYQRFFRPILNQMPYFDTTCMRCDAIDTDNGVDRIWLQTPMGTQGTIPSNTVLAQMIAELLSVECEEWLHKLECKAYQLQMFCTSPADIIKYNQMVDNSICHFMSYHVQGVKTNGFKADIIIAATLDVALMQTYYLYF